MREKKSISFTSHFLGTIFWFKTRKKIDKEKKHDCFCLVSLFSFSVSDRSTMGDKISLLSTATDRHHSSEAFTERAFFLTIHRSLPRTLGYWAKNSSSSRRIREKKLARSTERKCTLLPLRSTEHKCSYIRSNDESGGCPVLFCYLLQYRVLK